MHGTLQSITGSSGQFISLGYNASQQLSLATDHLGRTLEFYYNASNRIQKIIQPDNRSLSFYYDSSDNLISVTQPNGDLRKYHYEDARFPNNLTGVTDENGNRYATWAYDAQGRAISSEHTGGVDKYTLAYNSGNTVVTDPLGTVRTKNLTTILGMVKSTGQTQPGGSGCGASASALTYDANGNVATRTDFNGNVTTYTYDLSRNLETKRVEASGKPEARTTSTQWHSYWRFPTKVAEPNKLTTWVYNGDTHQGATVTCAPANATVPGINGGTQPIGVLCQKIEQATTDASGSAGFAASATGTPRISSWSYNQYGQVLTADGPRTDVADRSTYTYYDVTDPDLGKRGNLATITNAQGHLTQITSYDLNGNPLTLIDPNGVTTTLTYDPRQRLTSRSVGNELTSYQYDGVGQLTQVTLPDNSRLNYTYDPAHRLTAISDTLGNQILYTLDAMGNRIKEDVKDPQGTLARTRARVYDALNRLQTLTGAGNE